MLLESYTKEIFRPGCNHSFESVLCFAHLDQDVSEALPYLNAVLGGFEYLQNPPSVTFRAQGKLITVHGRKIAINALKDEGGYATIPVRSIESPGRFHGTGLGRHNCRQEDK